MLGKIITGKGFKGTLQYIFGGGQLEDDHRAHLITTNLAGETPEEMAREFAKLKDMNKRVGKPVKHIPISFAKGETPSNEDMEKIAKEYLKEMGFKNCPFVVVKHTDTVDHKNGCAHFHLVTSRIDFKGKTITDKHEKYKNIDVLEKLSIKYGYKPVSLKKNDIKNDSYDYNKKGENEMSKNKMRRPDGEENDSNYFDWGLKLDEKGHEKTYKNNELPYPLSSHLKFLYVKYKYNFIEDKSFMNLFQKAGSDPKTGAIQITLKDNSTIVDNGNTITSSNGKNYSEQADVMIKLAKLKNWKSVCFEGDNEFILEAWKQSYSASMQVSVLEGQEKLFEKFKEKNPQFFTVTDPFKDCSNDQDPFKEKEPEPENKARKPKL